MTLNLYYVHNPPFFPSKETYLKSPCKDLRTTLPAFEAGIFYSDKIAMTRSFYLQARDFSFGPPENDTKEHLGTGVVWALTQAPDTPGLIPSSEESLHCEDGRLKAPHTL